MPKSSRQFSRRSLALVVVPLAAAQIAARCVAPVDLEQLECPDALQSMTLAPGQCQPIFECGGDAPLVPGAGEYTFGLERVDAVVDGNAVYGAVRNRRVRRDLRLMSELELRTLPMGEQDALHLCASADAEPYDWTRGPGDVEYAFRTFRQDSSGRVFLRNLALRVEEQLDAGVRDAEAEVDAASESDSGSVDAGSADTGAADAGNVDAGESDSGKVDAGYADAGEVPSGSLCDVRQLPVSAVVFNEPSSSTVCNVSGVLLEDGDAVGLSRSSQAELFYVDDLPMTACVEVAFDDVYEANAVRLVVRGANEACGDSCVEPYCGTGHVINLFGSADGESFQRLRGVEIPASMGALEVPVTGTFSSVLACRSGAGAGRDNIELDVVELCSATVP